MGGIVLVVGLAMAAVGAYEMVAGYGDILSERGWSAFIAGAVLLSGGVVTMALGMAVRAIDRLRTSMFLDRAAVVDARSHVEPPELGSPANAPAPAAQADLFPEPSFEQAPTAPVLVAAPIEQALAHEVHPSITLPPPQAEPEPHREAVPPAGSEPQHDWLDNSFADLEREMDVRHEPAEATARLHAAPVAAVAELEPVATPETAPPVHAPHSAHDEPPLEFAAHDPGASATLAAEPVGEPAEQAKVSAREAPAVSAVIGRYESEGTSYVMYADGSIDAQSDAGVYRFASMSELKSFIER